MELFKKLLIGILSFVVLLFYSCKMDEAVVVVGVSFEPEREFNYVHEKCDWTVMVYMPADNNMEKSAMEEINEMEVADFDSEKNHVIVLVDTNNSMEGYEEEWKGTRLYEVVHDKNGMNNKIASLRLGCRELNLSSTRECELDMSDPDILKNFVSSTKKYYPAEHYAFIMWGECSGYSGKKSDLRAVAFDDTSLSYMDNSDFADSLKNGLEKKFDMLALDSCFGSEIELLSEFERCAEYCVGIEGLQKTEGWDYRSLLNVLNQENADGKILGQSILESQLKDNISLVDLSGVKSLCDEFDLFAGKIAESIKIKTTAEKMKNEILASDFCFMPHESSVNPVYVDIKSLAQKYGGQSLVSCIEKMSECKNQNYGGIGVFFCNMDENNNLMEKIPADYVKNGDGSNCSFVENSNHYAFSKGKSGTLLDKLFGNYF